MSLCKCGCNQETDEISGYKIRHCDKPKIKRKKIDYERITKDGYKEVYAGTRNGRNYYRSEHVLIVEKVLGRHLKKNELVHHINGDGLDNRNSNLLVCDRGYHSWLHKKMCDLYMKEKFGETIPDAKA